GGVGVRCLPAADRARVVIADLGPIPQPGGGQIFLWDPGKDADPVLLRDQVGPTWSAVLSPDNRFLVATEAASRVRVYDAVTGKPTRSFAGRDHEMHPAFSENGRLLATAGLGLVRTIRLYDFPSGRVLQEIKSGA